MNTDSLKDRIIELLKTHNPSSDQLLALLNTDDDVRALKLSKPRLLEILRALVSARTIVKTYNPVRYSLVQERYAWMYDSDVPHNEHGYILYRRGGIIITIGKGMTEDEARTCATALNELERKVMALRPTRS